MSAPPRACLLSAWHLTPPSSGQPKARCACFRLPLMSNVRPFMSGALVIAKRCHIAGGAIQAHGHPGLPVRWRSAHRPLCAIEATSSTKAESSRVATVAPPPGGAGRACASAGPLSVALLTPGSCMSPPSARLRVAGNASSCGAVGPCGVQNTRSAVGWGHAQGGPLFTRPNWSSERTSKRRCLLAAAQLQR